MPRIFTSTNEPLDFCKPHLPSEEEAEEEYGYLGDGPDDRGNCFSHNAEHPPYQGEDYHCEICGKLLDAEDD